MPIEHINKTDTLNEGREKLNAAIDGANAADVTSKAADTKATQALANSESTQTQLDTIVIDGDSSVEAAQARVDEKGDPHPTLKARIDDGLNSVNSELAHKANQSELDSTKQAVTNLQSQKADQTFVEESLSQKASQVDLNTEKGRIDNLVANAGDTDGNAELLDIRVGWDGIIYPTAGEAVRSIQQFMTSEDEEWVI